MEDNLPAPVKNVAVGFSTAEGFDLIQRQAKVLASSALVPKEYQGNIANCIIGLEIANRMNASPLAVLQNLYIVHGKPGWSSTFIIAAINSTGKFSPLRFFLTDPEKPKEVTATIYEFGKPKTVKETIANQTCTAWVIETATGERLESPPVSLEMAVKEGWYSKNGSKWQTMPLLMLRYRAAAFFGRLYAPEVLMGMPTVEEAQDIGANMHVALPAASVAARFIEDPVINGETETMPGDKTPEDVNATAEGLAGDKLALYEKVAELAAGDIFEMDKTLKALSGGRITNRESLIAAPDALVKEVLVKISGK